MDATVYFCQEKALFSKILSWLSLFPVKYWTFWSLGHIKWQKHEPVSTSWHLYLQIHRTLWFSLLYQDKTGTKLLQSDLVLFGWRTHIGDTYNCQKSLPSAWFDFCPLKHQALQLMVDFPVLPLRIRKGIQQCLGIHRRFLRWQTISPKEKKEEVMFLLYYTWVPPEQETLSKQGEDPDSQSGFHSSLTSR